MIVAAAAKIDGEVRALPAPARHHDVLHRYPISEGHDHGEQGFIDDQFGFLGRGQAYWRAKDEGQLEGRIKTGDPNGTHLFSEDLW